jgi:hypothetical protein
MLFLSNQREVETGQPQVEIQPLINGLLALSAFVLGIPYVIWRILKRRESLTGPEKDLSGSPRWTGLARLSGKGWLALSLIAACPCSCLLTAILFWLIQSKK